MPKAQPQRGCPPSLYLMSPRNTIFDVQKFCIIGYMKSLAYSPDFIFLLYFIYGAAECGFYSVNDEAIFKVLDAAKEVFNNHLVEVKDALDKLE
jgi:hypothetical protein